MTKQNKTFLDEIQFKKNNKNKKKNNNNNNNNNNVGFGGLWVF